MSLADYHSFIAGKSLKAGKHGFTPDDLPARMFEHQKRATEYALEKGRAALFLDTGLGKSLSALEFGRVVVEKTNKSVLMLAPLAVGPQMTTGSVVVTRPRAPRGAPCAWARP